MEKLSALNILRNHENTLKNLGVIHAGIFGSVARGNQTLSSDIDIMIELDANKALDAFAYAGLKRYIAGLFPVPVDVVNRHALKRHIAFTAESDLVDAF